MSSRPLAGLAAAAALALALPAGCGAPPPVRLEVDPGAYVVRGDYLGGPGVKVFVERLRADPRPVRESTVVVARLVLIEDGPQPRRFDLGKNRLEAASRAYSPSETHTLILKPGEVTPVMLTFPTHLPFDDFDGGTLHIEGLEGAPRYKVPFSAIEE